MARVRAVERVELARKVVSAVGVTAVLSLTRIVP